MTLPSIITDMSSMRFTFCPKENKGSESWSIILKQRDKYILGHLKSQQNHARGQFHCVANNRFEITGVTENKMTFVDSDWRFSELYHHYQNTVETSGSRGSIAKITAAALCVASAARGTGMIRKGHWSMYALPLIASTVASVFYHYKCKIASFILANVILTIRSLAREDGALIIPRNQQLLYPIQSYDILPSFLHKR
jgi:hypothetical protein